MVYTNICMEIGTDPQVLLRIHIFPLFLSEAPPVKLEKYTYKKVLDLVNSLAGNDFNEVLILTMEQKDQQRQQKRVREEEREAEIAAKQQLSKRRQPKGKNTTGTGQNMPFIP